MENHHSRNSVDSASSIALLALDENSIGLHSDGNFHEAEKTPQHPLLVEKPFRTWNRSKLTRIIQQILLISLALVGLVNIVTFLAGLQLQKYKVSYNGQNAAEYSSHPCDCGNSVAEAISLGCVYDELSAAWLPERCRDDELTAEFGRQGDDPKGTWMYFADKNRTQLLTVEEVSRLADIHPAQYFHMTHEWHRIHCLFLWLKEHRFKVNGKYFDPRYDSDKHIRHCMDMMLNVHFGTAAGASLLG